MWQSRVKKRTAGAYRRFFDTDDGRLILRDLMKAHHIFSSTYQGDKDIQLREGERNVVLRILTICNIGEDELLKMIEESEE